MQNHTHARPDSYFAPEIVELGAASALTLGQRDLPAADGCQCAKAAESELSLTDVGC